MKLFQQLDSNVEFRPKIPRRWEAIIMDDTEWLWYDILWLIAVICFNNADREAERGGNT